MSIASVDPRFAFGFKGDVKDNVYYLDEQCIIYPSGCTTILYNVDQNSQRFINGTEGGSGVTAVAISPNRRYVALAEVVDSRAIVSIYDLHTLRKRKVLSAPDSEVPKFISLGFSPDSKYLVAQGCGPEWTLIYWTWEKAKVMATACASNQHNAEIHQISFNPHDNTQISVVGNGIFKLFRYSEMALKPFAYQKMETHNYLCHAWIEEQRVVIGTEQGKILLFESGELKAEFSNAHGPNKTLNAINSIIPYSKGFICAGNGAWVHLYEKTEDKDLYKKAKECQIDSTRTMDIMSLTVSPSEETLICSTKCSQLYSLTLSNTEILKDDDVKFDIFSQSFHHGAITGMDVCVRKPIIATTGLDCSVRIWNYQDNSLELVKYFQEEAYSIALHPSGLHVLVGFSDKLRLMNILIDDIRPFKELTIRGCRECQFSNGGHLFAAIHSNVIQIYQTYTFENIMNLKAHNGKVRSVQWGTDDSKLISCGMDGAVYEWSLQLQKRDAENVLKSCSYTCAVVSPDGKATYAVGTDKQLKHISESQIVHSFNAKTVLTQLAMSKSGRMLFAGTANGMVRSVKFPLQDADEWTDQQAHCKAISRMRISFDDQFLFTVGDDGTLFTFKITDKEQRSGSKREKEIRWADEILITKSDLEEKNHLMAELKTRVEELKMETEYQLRLKDMNYNEKIKDITEKGIQEIEALRIHNSVLKAEKDKEAARHDEEISELKDSHQRELQEIEALNNQKLMTEYEKHQAIQAKMMEMGEKYERQISEMTDNKEEALEELTEYYEAKLKEKIVELNTLKDELQQQLREFQETVKQVEEDADREILDLKTKYEHKLKDEKESSLRLKGENGIMRKKFNSLEKEIEEHKNEIQKMFGEQRKLHTVIKGLEKDIVGLKKEIQERDETIQEKEKRIYDLKKKNQELEKFKFVLDYKIKELKKQIEPREHDIKAMREQIQEMDRELERYHKQNNSLELLITDLKLKLRAADKENGIVRQKVRDSDAISRRFRTELSEAVRHFQDPKALKDSVKHLYHKYVHDESQTEPPMDADIQHEYNRQREYLERNLASLRTKLAKDGVTHKADSIRVMQENVALIQEINDLRKELKEKRKRVREMEISLGQRKQWTGKNQDTSKTDKDQLSRMLDLQKDEIRRLREIVKAMETTKVDKPPMDHVLPVLSV